MVDARGGTRDSQGARMRRFVLGSYDQESIRRQRDAGEQNIRKEAILAWIRAGYDAPGVAVPMLHQGHLVPLTFGSSTTRLRRSGTRHRC